MSLVKRTSILQGDSARYSIEKLSKLGSSQLDSAVDAAELDEFKDRLVIIEYIILKTG